MRIFSTLLAGLGLVSLGHGAIPEEKQVRSIALRTHTLTQPYLDSDMQSRWYDFGGDTIIRTDSHIRLASNLPSQAGWIFSRVPLTATNWEIEVEFKITGTGQLFGDGLAMWLTKSRAQTGQVFGSSDKFEGLGVFIDTYKNNRPGVVFPYVMAMMGDGQTSYDKNNDGKANELAGCSARGLRNANVPTKLRLTYFQDKILRLELQYKKEDDWIQCFEVESPPTIPQVAYLGFSAETGELTDNHDIISVKAKNLYKSPTASSNTNNNSGSKGKKGKKAKAKSYADAEGSSWTWFFFKIILFILVVGGIYVGFTAWRTQQARKSYRF
ncbi:L-type lectin-like domain-containing protein [Ceratocystis platani]|uniref:L-type lectin-like domain-containing protein n=1 Tax=Ceratocystis fimbriata f. sp. platani TaxID=88771 RepID=A0A0F8BSP9_CERFI|nr:L-type lectin-like domain-containing protein [Ceratocystis platani]